MSFGAPTEPTEPFRSDPGLILDALQKQLLERAVPAQLATAAAQVDGVPPLAAEADDPAGPAWSPPEAIETIAAKGLFCSLYTDRGSHYFHTPVAGQRVAAAAPTQFGRALRQLGIRHIPAYSP